LKKNPNDRRLKYSNVVNAAGRLRALSSLLQARKAELVQRPFFADFSETAIWFNDLKPAFDEVFAFFEQDEHLFSE
jgi:hypothetical protein